MCVRVRTCVCEWVSVSVRVSACVMCTFMRECVEVCARTFVGVHVCASVLHVAFVCV